MMAQNGTRKELNTNTCAAGPIQGLDDLNALP